MLFSAATLDGRRAGEDRVYRIDLVLAGPDPRVALRAEAALDEAALVDLRARSGTLVLGRFARPRAVDRLASSFFAKPERCWPSRIVASARRARRLPAHEPLGWEGHTCGGPLFSSTAR